MDGLLQQVLAETATGVTNNDELVFNSKDVENVSSGKYVYLEVY